MKRIAGSAVGMSQNPIINSGCYNALFRQKLAKLRDRDVQVHYLGVYSTVSGFNFQ